MLNVEIFDLIGSLSSGNDVQEFSQAVLLEVLLGQVLQVSLWEWNVSWDGDLAGIVCDVDLFTQVTNLSVDFYSGFQKLSEVAGVEDLIFDWLGAVNWEVVADFLLLGNFLTHG